MGTYRPFSERTYSTTLGFGKIPPLGKEKASTQKVPPLGGEYVKVSCRGRENTMTTFFGLEAPKSWSFENQMDFPDVPISG